MRTYKRYPTTQLFEDKLTCNKCGKVYDVIELEEWQAEFMHKFKVSFGYASEYDGQTFSFDLCESCLIEFVKSFKIPVDVERWLE